MKEILGRILYAKNENQKLPNASTTKVLTAIVAYENADMREIAVVSQNAATVGGSTVKLRKDDKVMLNDLMYGMLLCSGNDAAIVIAEHVAGSVTEFCEMMNDKAKNIGAVNTNFTSPHGLDDEEHYSTAYDLAIITDYALDIPYIANIVKSKKETIKINNYTRDVFTTNEMLSLYNNSDGVKTGYTGNAGRCLITSATRNNWQLITVVLGCESKSQRTNESKKILDYGFNNYKLVDLCENMQKKFVLSVQKGAKCEYSINIDCKYLYPLNEEEIENISYIYEIDTKKIAPIKQGEELGKIVIKLGANVVEEVKIIASNEVLRKSIKEYILLLMKNLINMPK